MSVAYYIVLDKENPGFDPFVNGKHLAREAKRINKVATKLGLKRMDEFVSYDEAPAASLLRRLGGAEAGWHSPEEGAEWVGALLARFREDSRPLGDPDGVIADLQECLEVLRRAKQVGARWHFAIDI